MWTDDLAALPEAERLELIASLPAATVETLAYDWGGWRRPAQVPPAGDWRYWLILAGRGFGKTRVGAEGVRAWATSGDYRYVNIIAPTVDDVRDICVEGESGVLAICPPHERPRYIPSKRRLEWPNGCWSLLFSADEPERLRGKQHQALWCDELASWRKDGGAWTQAKLGLRLPPDPRAIITTTPKPLKYLKTLMENPATVITRGSTYDNIANLDPEFFAEIIVEYEGTYLGRQELEGQYLSEAEGALWRRHWIDDYRVEAPPLSLARVAVGVDPPGGATECGIVAAGLGMPDREAVRQQIEQALARHTPEASLDAQRVLAGRLAETARGIQHRYVLADASEKLSAAKWGVRVWRTALAVKADVIAAEKNFGGDMVLEVLRAAAAENAEFKGRALPPVVLVSASRGKAVRAEPVATMAEQGRLHHVGRFDDLEDELCTWEPGNKSPNRLDALVWAIAALEMSPAESGRLEGWM